MVFDGDYFLSEFKIPCLDEGCGCGGYPSAMAIHLESEKVFVRTRVVDNTTVMIFDLDEAEESLEFFAMYLVASGGPTTILESWSRFIAEFDQLLAKSMS